MTTSTLTTSVRVTRAWAAGTPITRRAAAAACATSLLLATGVPGPLVAGVALALAGCLMAAAALVDVHELRLPNPMVGGALGLSWAAAAAMSPVAFGRSIAGMTVAGGLMLAVRLSRGVGMGDVKLAAAVGAGAGALALPLAPLAVAVAALAAGGFGLATGRRRLPMGPSLWLGWAVALLVAGMGWW